MRYRPGRSAPRPRPFVEAAKVKASAVVTAGQSVQAQIPSIKDKTPLWASLLELGLWGGIIAAVIFGLTAAGAWPFIRSIFAFIPSLIPSSIKTAAKLDAETIAAGDVTTAQARRIEAAKADPRYRRQLKSHLAAAKTLPTPTPEAPQ